MTRKYHNQTQQFNLWHHKEKPNNNIIVTRHQVDNLNKATNSLNLSLKNNSPTNNESKQVDSNQMSNALCTAQFGKPYLEQHTISCPHRRAAKAHMILSICQHVCVKVFAHKG